MSNLQFIYRAKNKENAQRLVKLLQKKFGFWDGKFELEGVNIRGYCTEHNRDVIKGYCLAIVDIDDGTLDLGEAA